MLKLTPLAVGLLTLLSVAPNAQATIATSSLQSGWHPSGLHAQVIMKGGGGQAPQNREQSPPSGGQSSPSGGQSTQNREQSPQSGSQSTQNREQSAQGREQSERPHQTGFARERGAERRRPEHFSRRHHRQHEGRGEWLRERRHDR